MTEEQMERLIEQLVCMSLSMGNIAASFRKRLEYLEAEQALLIEVSEKMPATPKPRPLEQIYGPIKEEFVLVDALAAARRRVTHLEELNENLKAQITASSADYEKKLDENAECSKQIIGIKNDTIRQLKARIAELDREN